MEIINGSISPILLWAAIVLMLGFFLGWTSHMWYQEDFKQNRRTRKINHFLGQGR